MYIGYINTYVDTCIHTYILSWEVVEESCFASLVFAKERHQNGDIRRKFARNGSQWRRIRRLLIVPRNVDCNSSHPCDPYVLRWSNIRLLRWRGQAAIAIWPGIDILRSDPFASPLFFITHRQLKWEFNVPPNTLLYSVEPAAKPSCAMVLQCNAP